MGHHSSNTNEHESSTTIQHNIQNNGQKYNNEFGQIPVTVHGSTGAGATVYLANLQQNGMISLQNLGQFQTINSHYGYNNEFGNNNINAKTVSGGNVFQNLKLPTLNIHYNPGYVGTCDAGICTI